MSRLLTASLVLLLQFSNLWGFHFVLRLRRCSLRLHAEEVPWESAFPDAQVLTIQMQEHIPLGCTVEESLADSDLKPVFVSKVRSFFVEVNTNSLTCKSDDYLLRMRHPGRGRELRKSGRTKGWRRDFGDLWDLWWDEQRSRKRH